MNTHQTVTRDERTVAVENVSSRWGFTFLLFALLVDVAYRGVVYHEAAWDLMALVIVSSGFLTIYGAQQKTLPTRTAVLGVCLAGLAAAMIAAMYKLHLLH
jgi:hypothetical protein